MAALRGPRVRTLVEPEQARGKLTRVVGDTAVLAYGPAPGTRVVTAGAAELWGTETGFTK